MNQETKSRLKKILTEGDGFKKMLIWGGGAFLVFIGLRLVWGAFWSAMNLPVWIPLLIGGGGYYAYKKLKGGRDDR